MRYKGYCGKYIKVDLTKRKIEVLPFPEELAEEFLGGSGVGTKILWENVEEKVDPLSPENKLIFATGPLTGTIWPSSGRLTVISKSPLTGIYGDASSGGFFAPELKFAGYDFIVIEGKSAVPVYLYIENDDIQLYDASDLWGMTTFETEEAIKKRHFDNEIKVACIGPAGENLVRYACIWVSYGRTASRSGMGAVMGAKKLKAIAVRGYKRIEVYKPDRFYEIAVKSHEKIKKNPYTSGESQYGTASLVMLMNEVGRFPTKNFQMGDFIYAEDISAESLEKRHFVKHLACFCCPIGCDKIYIVKEGEFAGTTTVSLEYETLCSLGSKCFNRNLESIIKMDNLCNSFGIDTISFGGVISFLMELKEHGLNVGEFMNIDLEWGNYHTMIKLLNDTVYRRGIGDLLAEGVLRLSRKLGKKTSYYAMHVKGQEIPAQDGRAQQSMGLAQVTSSRGADHLKGFPTIDETGYPTEAVGRYGKKYLPEIVNGTETKYKPMVVKDGEELCAICDSAVVCKFGVLFPPAIYWSELVDGLKYATGMDLTVKKLKEIGERIYNLQRCYNVIHGITRKDDILPDRLLTEPSPSKKAKGHVVYLTPMLNEYYKLRGWNIKTGIPGKKKIIELGLKDVYLKIKKCSQRTT